jgi:SAM-dependent methyltransferase
MTLTAFQQRTEIRCPVCLARETAVVRLYRTGQIPSLSPFADLSIRSCEHCHAAFACPFPEETALEAFYAASYRLERGQGSVPLPNAWDGGSVRARAQVEFVLGHFNSVRSWLDIGAGHGLLLDEARRRHIARTGAIEPDIHCGWQIQEAGHHLYAGLSDVQSSWDVVSCSHVLEHLTNPRQFLKDVQGLLSEQGHVFCEVPNETHLSESPRDLPHLLFFTESTLIRLFRENGLRIIAVSSCGRKVPHNRWGTIMNEGFRRASQKLFRRPPHWIDRLIHPHFHYHDDLSMGTWLRLLARKA